MKDDERCDMKRTPTTFGAALKELVLTLIKLENSSAKANQVSDLTIG